MLKIGGPNPNATAPVASDAQRPVGMAEYIQIWKVLVAVPETGLVKKVPEKVATICILTSSAVPIDEGAPRVQIAEPPGLIVTGALGSGEMLNGWTFAGDA